MRELWFDVFYNYCDTSVDADEEMERHTPYVKKFLKTFAKGINLVDVTFPISIKTKYEDFYEIRNDNHRLIG